MDSRGGVDRVKVYCPQCQDIFPPDLKRQSNLDGANFGGITFPNFFLKQFAYLYPKDGKETYIPKIFGFKIFSQAGSKYEYEYDLDGNCTNKA